MSLKNHVHSRLTRRAGIAVLALLAMAGPAATVGIPSAAAQTSEPVLSGLYAGGGDVAGVEAFGKWRGREVGVVQEFVDARSWSTIANPTWAADRWQDAGATVVWSVPMLPATGGTIQNGAAGSYDSHFRALSKTLVSRGFGDSVVRLGWEMNGSWFPWSAVKDPDAYKRYWRSAVTAMRSVGGAQFKFEWAPNLGADNGFDPTRAYPGDAYVDLIGMSMYDQSWSHSPQERVERWKSQVTTDAGLQWSVDFARAHGKQNSLSEWGLSDRCDGHGGGDNPYYIEQVSKWVAAHDYYYETYFDYRTSNCEQHSITEGNFSQSRAAYTKSFGAAAAVVQSTGALATSDESVVKVSWNSDRSDARPLSWAGVTSKVYIFVEPAFPVDRVKFYLDDPSMTGPAVSTENYAHWDLKGGNAATANAFHADTLPAGTHTLTVLFETPTGDKVTTVQFLR